MKTHDQIAEAIIKTEGLMFALAVAGGREGSISEARQYLKAAIMRALAAEADLHRSPSSW